MSKKRIHRKPIGDAGPIHVTNVGGNPVVEWKKFNLPAKKAAQEMSIAGSFIDALNTQEGAHWGIEPLHENDFDFLMREAGEERYLELQEIVIPPKKRGSPYSDREQVVRTSKFADTIASGMQRKISKYTNR